MEVTRYVQIEMREPEPGRIVGRAAAPDYLRDDEGVVRPGVLLTMLDSAGGLCGGLAALPDGWVVTTNMTARSVAPARVGPFRTEAAPLRVGRNTVVTTVEIRDEGAGDALVLDGVLTSAILVPESGPPNWPRPVHIPNPALPGEQPPIAEWLNLRRVDDGVEVDIAEGLRNPWGILHGGVVAMMVDLAVDNPRDFALHYLAPNRVGPVRATVQQYGNNVARVEVRDVGADRVTAVGIVS